MNKYFSKSKIVALLFAATLAILVSGIFQIDPIITVPVFGALAFLPNEIGVLALNQTNGIAARQTYDIARKLLFNAMKDDPAFKGSDAAAWDWVNSRKLSQGDIRLETGFSATSTRFQFGLTQNQPNSSNLMYNTENRLTMQDILICSEYKIEVAQPASDTDVAYQPRTYGNQIDFGNAFAQQIDQIFYSNGSYRLTCNGDVIVPYRAMRNHLYRPQTQQTAALGAASPGDQLRGNEDGFITCEPNVLYIGQKGYIPEIVLKTALSAATTYSRIILTLSGCLAQNSTDVS
jgi:hypothetical protein